MRAEWDDPGLFFRHKTALRSAARISSFFRIDSKRFFHGLSGGARARAGMVRTGVSIRSFIIGV
jgi:hypothetical protein